MCSSWMRISDLVPYYVLNIFNICVSIFLVFSFKVLFIFLILVSLFVQFLV